MSWVQHQFRLRAFPRGFHLVTSEVLAEIPELSRCRIGLLHVFIQHTSASISLNENADPDVRVDMETAFNRIAPEDQPFVHTLEGPDDMPAHVKASVLGSSISIPVANGRLCTGTWQGIYLCEHRNRASGRGLVVTLNGEFE